MKETIQDLVSFLKGMGVDVEIAAEGEASEFDNDAILTAIDGNRRGILQPLIESELRESVQSAIAGKIGALLEKELIQQTGISSKEFDGIKTDKEKIAKAIAYKMSLLDADKEESGKRIDDILNANKVELDKLRAEYEGRLKESNERFTNKEIMELIESDLLEFNVPKGASTKVLAGDIMRAMRDMHHVKYDETNKDVLLFSSANPEMPSLNESKTARITRKDFAKGYLDARGLNFNDMRNINPKDQMQNIGGTPNQGSQPAKKMLLGNGENQVAATMDLINSILPKE